jgi:hypothetical protein
MKNSLEEAIRCYQDLCSRHKKSVPFEVDLDSCIENEMWIALADADSLIALFSKNPEKGLVPHSYSYGIHTVVGHGKLLPMTVLTFSNGEQHVIAGGRLARPAEPEPKD